MTAAPSARLQQMIEKCPHCGGSVVGARDEDTGKPIRKCLMCSREFAGEGQRMVDSVNQLDWKQVALARYKAILAQTAAMDGLKAEAEMLARVLALAEQTGVPALPWRAQKGAAGSTRKPKTFPTCAECGRQFTAPSQYTGGVKSGKPAVCRDGCVPIAVTA
jgi:hypothetical protein